MTQSKIALVTGAAGFLGSHLVDRLLTEGFAVIGVDNLLTGQEANLQKALLSPNFRFIKADAAQPTSNFLSPQTAKFTHIFHFASPASPPQYQAYPHATYLVNSIGTHYLLEFLHQHSPAAKFVFASTSEIYGNPLVHPQPESYWGNVNPNGVRSCYDEGKRLGETICGVWARTQEVDVRIARIFNTYGPRMNPNDGRIIPNFIKQAHAKKAYSIYGDGQQTRSFCFVDDLIEGIWRLATYPQAKGQTINLGNPSELTVLQAAKAVHKVVRGENEPFNTEHFPLPADDPEKRNPDITQAMRLLDWSPKVSFEDGLGRIG